MSVHNMTSPRQSMDIRVRNAGATSSRATPLARSWGQARAVSDGGRRWWFGPPNRVPPRTPPGGSTPVDALLGPLIDTCLHEFGHAIFDMLRVPTFGREEDAADQGSAYIMLQLGKAEARRLFLGTAYAYKTEFEAATAPHALKAFANVHGTPAQRFYNLLCIAYGADAQLFGDLVAKGYLPKERAEDCEGEYKQVAFAIQKLIAPHIDARRARKVFDKSWLPEPTRRVQRRPGMTQPTQPQ